jgi:hypothetical protein
MALTKYQINILRLLADSRKKAGESYIAGGAALNQLLKAPRKSRDLNIFHDTTEALEKSFSNDRKILEQAGYIVEIERALPSFFEAVIIKETDRVIIQWVRDSAFRFFPLIEDKIFGLVLHPFDLATNKILTMAGRLEPRDWIDVIECNISLQHFGYLVWAACGKDPGVNPDMIIAEAARIHYTQVELDTLDFEIKIASAKQLSKQWKEIISDGKSIIDKLPEDLLGMGVLDRSGKLYKGNPDQIADDIKGGNIQFHQGTIGGVWPVIKK